MQSGLLYVNIFKFLNSTYWFIPVQLAVILIISRGLGFLSKAKKMERKEKELKEAAAASKSTTPSSKAVSDDSKKTQ